jgi:hypothetical protein
MSVDCPVAEVGAVLIVDIEDGEVEAGAGDVEGHEVWVWREVQDRVDVSWEKLGDIEEDPGSEGGVAERGNELDKRGVRDAPAGGVVPWWGGGCKPRFLDSKNVDLHLDGNLKDALRCWPTLVEVGLDDPEWVS